MRSRLLNIADAPAMVLDLQDELPPLRRRIERHLALLHPLIAMDDGVGDRFRDGGADIPQLLQRRIQPGRKGPDYRSCQRLIF